MKYLLSILTFVVLLSCTAQQPSQYSKIQYRAGACFGFCPIFKITINPDKSAIIEAERFTFSDGQSKDDFSKPKEGTYKATIKDADYKTLISKLNSLNIKSLENYYGHKNVTDLPTSHLTITFADGTEKQIEDYGKRGTDELGDIYSFIENLRKSQTWTKVE